MKDCHCCSCEKDNNPNHIADVIERLMYKMEDTEHAQNCGREPLDFLDIYIILEEVVATLREEGEGKYYD